MKGVQCDHTLALEAVLLEATPPSQGRGKPLVSVDDPGMQARSHKIQKPCIWLGKKDRKAQGWATAARKCLPVT